MDNRLILFGLHELPGIGWQTIRLIMEQQDDLSAIFEMDVDHLCGFGIMMKKAQLIKAKLTPSFIERRCSLYEQEQIHFFTRLDEKEYPALLKETAQPPWVLYCKGNSALLQQPTIAVVGTRSPTAYGIKVTEQLAYDLSRNGCCVASGMARGIDSAAHIGALRALGGTVAILGCGVDHIYPRENRRLYEQLVDEGLLLSEYPTGTAMHPGLFPLRNRIIAGLSLGTVVVEAARRSGSLITADLALEESRDVFAIPGPVTSPKSAGTFELLKQGAKMATCADDILEEYKHLITWEKHTYIINNQQNLFGDEQKILSLLSAVPIHIDSLKELSGIELGQLHTILLSLLMSNKIKQLPGSNFISI